MFSFSITGRLSLERKGRFKPSRSLQRWMREWSRISWPDTHFSMTISAVLGLTRANGDSGSPCFSKKSAHCLSMTRSSNWNPRDRQSIFSVLRTLLDVDLESKATGFRCPDWRCWSSRQRLDQTSQAEISSVMFSPSHCIKSRLICSNAPKDKDFTSGLTMIFVSKLEMCLHADKQVVWESWVWREKKKKIDERCEKEATDRSGI